MSWEQQLLAMIEADHLDRDTINDLGVAYAEETGDESLIDTFTLFGQSTVYPLWNGSLSGTHYYTAYTSKSTISAMGSTSSGSLSDSEMQTVRFRRSGSDSIGGTYVTARSRSWSASVCRPWSGRPDTRWD